MRPRGVHEDPSHGWVLPIRSKDLGIKGVRPAQGRVLSAKGDFVGFRLRA
jgi:hypothetical protein